MAFDDLMETSKGKLKDWNEGRIKRSAEKKVTFLPTTFRDKITDKKFGSVTMYQQVDDNLVYFDKNDSILFEFIDYTWSGPQYKTVLKTDTKEEHKGKTKRKGRLLGAAVGSVIAPGVGTVIGAMAGTGNKKHQGTTDSHSVTYEEHIELDTPASMRIKKINDNEIINIDFSCNTSINNELKQFVKTKSIETNITSTPIDVEVIEKENPYEEIKKLKELLDMGILTQDEFDTKKKQILNI
jgi:hypothetical protein